MSKSSRLIIFLCFLSILASSQTTLRSGRLTLITNTLQEPEIRTQIDITSKNKVEIKLTQSSKVTIQGKLLFNQDSFSPEFIAFRLINKRYQNLTQPVLGDYDANERTLTSLLDIGNPLFIQPFSDVYQLEILIGDDRLQNNFRNIIATLDITFRKSLNHPPVSHFHYVPKNQIIFTLPPERIDPPFLFTLFVSGLVLTSFFIFAYALSHLRANLQLFPTTSSGFLLNFLFVGLMGIIAAILVKFWINWTFLETIKYLSFTIIPTLIVGNYALLQIKK